MAAIGGGELGGGSGEDWTNGVDGGKIERGNAEAPSLNFST